MEITCIMSEYQAIVLLIVIIACLKQLQGISFTSCLAKYFLGD